VVEPAARPLADAQRLYNSVIAQVAVRTVREVFMVTPGDMVSTVVFNGHVDTVDPATGRKIRPPLISVRATREKFDELVLAEPVSIRPLPSNGTSSRPSLRIRRN
jgi:restriction system protein